ncbi:hypothetical protein Tco_0626979 [Tanacetum coccineum]|uniref:Reverse transcriptase domain-containing protein n=1 Tax=Tanacetum coccineum TaxID=301880 RepID=A0ABQ4WL74_9ASTR
MQIKEFFKSIPRFNAFDISFADKLSFRCQNLPPTIKRSMLMNKEKLFELAKIQLNENCSAMLLKKLLEKLGDPGKFLIPCDYPGMDTRRRRLCQSGISLPTDFSCFDFEADPCGFLTFGGRSFLRTRYSSTYDDMLINRIDVIDVACEEYSQEVPNEESDFILEEIKAFLKDDSISLEIDHTNCDPEGDICLIEKLLNNDPFQLPSMDLQEVTKEKSSIEEPPKLELKDLPSHLRISYLEGTEIVTRTDIAKISRKWSKQDKHGHENGIECARAERMLSKVNKSQPMVNSGQP